MILDTSAIVAVILGDCIMYAVAKLSGQALLCVGGDFAQTDLLLAPLTT